MNLQASLEQNAIAPHSGLLDGGATASDGPKVSRPEENLASRQVIKSGGKEPQDAAALC